MNTLFLAAYCFLVYLSLITAQQDGDFISDHTTTTKRATIDLPAIRGSEGMGPITAPPMVPGQGRDLGILTVDELLRAIKEYRNFIVWETNGRRTPYLKKNFKTGNTNYSYIWIDKQTPEVKKTVERLIGPKLDYPAGFICGHPYPNRQKLLVNIVRRCTELTCSTIREDCKYEDMVCNELIRQCACIHGKRFDDKEKSCVKRQTCSSDDKDCTDRYKCDNNEQCKKYDMDCNSALKQCTCRSGTVFSTQEKGCVAVPVCPITNRACYGDYFCKKYKDNCKAAGDLICDLSLGQCVCKKGDEFNRKVRRCRPRVETKQRHLQPKNEAELQAYLKKYHVIVVGNNNTASMRDLTGKLESQNADYGYFLLSEVPSSLAKTVESQMRRDGFTGTVDVGVPHGFVCGRYVGANDTVLHQVKTKCGKMQQTRCPSCQAYAETEAQFQALLKKNRIVLAAKTYDPSTKRTIKRLTLKKADFVYVLYKGLKLLKRAVYNQMFRDGYVVDHTIKMPNAFFCGHWTGANVSVVPKSHEKCVKP